jgi:hypothetical protein
VAVASTWTLEHRPEKLVAGLNPAMEAAIQLFFWRVIVRKTGAHYC